MNMHIKGDSLGANRKIGSEPSQNGARYAK